METRKIFSPTSGKEIPVTVDLNVKPLIYDQKVMKNGKGEVMMDDRWIYVVMQGYGRISINVNRSSYCEKVYLSNLNILDSIDKTPSRRLKKFIETISDKLVFKFGDTTYRVYLKYVKGKGYDIDSVKPFWALQGTGGIMPSWFAQEKKFGHDWHAKNPYAVDLKAIFNFDFNEN